MRNLYILKVLNSRVTPAPTVEPVETTVPPMPQQQPVPTAPEAPVVAQNPNPTPQVGIPVQTVEATAPSTNVEVVNLNN